MLPGALIMAVMSPITGIIFDRYGAKILTMTGLSIVLITTYFFTQFSASTTYLTFDPDLFSSNAWDFDGDDACDNDGT